MGPPPTRSLFSLLAIQGCVAPGGGGGAPGGDDPGADCRLAAFACAPGFACVEAATGWACVLGADGAPSDGGAPADGDAGFDPDTGGSGLPDASPDATAPARSGPGGPCIADADCHLGRCVADPGGRCVVGCDEDDDCGPDAACVDTIDDVPTCVERCADAPCRDGWICADLDDRPVCLPDCAVVGCPEGFECRVDGVCAPPMCNPIAERCDGSDDDCDGRADEGAPCPAGSRCEAGRCRALSPAAGACNRDADCASGACLPPAEVPGGFCFQPCLDDRDCDPEGICALVGGDGASICGQPCEVTPCRAGWVCSDSARPFVCVPGCQAVGCDAGLVCRDDGFCELPRARVILEQVFISPAKSNGQPWDGFGGAVPGHLVDAALQAALGPNPIGPLLAALAPDILGAYDAPDPLGTATLFVDGQARELALPDIQDTLVPAWRGIEWVQVPITPDVDVRLRIRLTDQDLVNDDPIGTVSVSGEALRAALASGQVFPVPVVDQGAPILLVTVSVIAE